MFLDKLTLGFENCDSIDVPGDLVVSLSMSGIEGNMALDGPYGITRWDTCKQFCVVLDKKAGQLETTWDGNKKALNERIKEKDLVVVDVICDDRSDTYYVPWHDEDNYINPYMKVVCDEKTGNIVISVTEEG